MKPIPLDLGLSVRWADRNLGAETPKDKGFQPYHKPDFKNGAEETKYYNDLIKSRLGDKWRLPTVEEILELEKLSYQAVIKRFEDGKQAWWEGVYKLVSGRKHFYLPHNILVAGLSFFSLCGKNEKPGIFIPNPRSSRIYNSDAGYYSNCFYSFDASLIEKSGKEANTLIFIRPVTDEMPTMLDKMRQLSEDDPFKDYTEYPLKKLSIERIYDYSEEVYRQKLQQRQEIEDYYKRREEKERQSILASGRVYHKVHVIANYWEGEPYRSPKGTLTNTILLQRDELLSLISGGEPAIKSLIASNTVLFYDDIINANMSYNLSYAYDKNGNLLTDDY